MVIVDTKAWLYVKGRESVRIVVSGHSVDVYGPGADFSRSQFPEPMDAALHHAALEDSLVRSGWALEQLTTEHRSGNDRRRQPCAPARPGPGALRLVRGGDGSGA